MEEMSSKKTKKVSGAQPNLRVAMVAPPWLALPTKGYGGIERVIEGLVAELQKRGIEVVLFANGARKMRGITTFSLYKEEQYQHIYEPYYESSAIVNAHLLFAKSKILEDGKFDIIHDHTPHLGPMFWSLASQSAKLPPVLHTFHGPPFGTSETKDVGSVYRDDDLKQITDLTGLYFSCISDAMTKTVPTALKPHLLDAVHNAIDVESFPLVDQKKNYFITLARFAPYKGQHIAVRGAAKLRAHLRMMGIVAGDIASNRKLLFELANPLSPYRNDQQFRYYSDKIFPYVLRYPRITYSGNLSGQRKMKYLSESKALLFPIQWEEPFGVAVIEALACGTPVVAMDRGAMPEIIEHGVTGFLAKDENEFFEYMKRVDEIDPAACRRSVEEKFSAQSMATTYLDRYQEVVKRSKKTKK